MRWRLCAAIPFILACSALFVTPLARAHFLENQIFLVDASNRIVHVSTVTWNWTYVLGAASGITGPTSVGFDHETDMLIVNAAANNVLKIYGNSLTGNVVIDQDDGLLDPFGPGTIAIDGYGWQYVACTGASKILKVRQDHLVEWVFADASDGLVSPTDMEFLSTGIMLVANNGSGGEILQILPNGTTLNFDTIPGEEPYTIAVRPDQDVYVGCESGNVYRYAGASPGSRSLFGTWGGFPALAFNKDGSSLFHIATGVGQLRLIDPETAVASVVTTGPWSPRSISISGAQVPPGSFRNFGTVVVPGTGSVGPHLHWAGNPRIGQTYRVEMHDFVGWTQGYLYSGIASTATPFMGGVLYVDTSQTHTVTPIWLPGNPGAPGEGDWELQTYTIPADPLLVGTSLWFQGMADDPNAAQGLAMTHGIKLWIGD